MNEKTTLWTRTYHDLVDMMIYLKVTESLRGVHWEGLRNPDVEMMEGSVLAETLKDHSIGLENIRISWTPEEGFAHKGEHGITIENNGLEYKIFRAFTDDLFLNRVPNNW